VPAKAAAAEVAELDEVEVEEPPSSLLMLTS
jgi:hypothetical protein